MLGIHQRMKTKTLYGVYSPERGKLRIRKQKMLWRKMKTQKRSKKYVWVRYSFK